MSNSKEVMAAMGKQYGKGVVEQGVELMDNMRIPTGVFPFDLATGGGFPMGRVSIVYGPESSLKTTVALKAIATHQRLYPDMKCVFVDVETSYDPEWGAMLGVDNEKLIYVLPDYAEQAVDIMEGLLYAEDVGLVVVDSLAALITANEVDSSADKAVVGGSGLVVGKLYRKVTLALSRAKKEGRTPTFIAINQIRFKIGVMYGDPEVMPGGNAFKFASSLTVRMYGKDEIDKKVNAVLPAWKVCSGIIKKWKCPIVARNFEFKLATLERPGFNVGEADAWSTLSTYLRDQGKLAKAEKKGWVLFDETYPTLDAIRQRLRDEPEFNDFACASVLGLIMDKSDLSHDGDDADLDDDL